MAKKYVHDEEGMRRNVASIRKTEAMPVTEPLPKPTPVGSGMRENWIPCVATADEIPPYSFCRLGNGDSYSGYYRPYLNKPSTTFGTNYGVTGNWTIAANKPGAVMASFEVGIFKYEDSATPAFGDVFGAKPGFFELYKGYPGDVHVLGIWNSEKKLLLGTLSPITELFGHTSGACAKGTSGTVKIYAGVAGSEVDTGMTVTAWNHFADIADDVQVLLTFVNGNWKFHASECAEA